MTESTKDYLSRKAHETNEDVFLDDGSFVHHPVYAEDGTSSLTQHMNNAHPNWEATAADKIATKVAHEAIHRAHITEQRDRNDRFRPTDTWPDRIQVEGIAHGVPASAMSVTCHQCGVKPAAHKVGEETGPANFHNLTAYLCCSCFGAVMGAAHDDHPYDESWANQSPFRDLFTGADWERDEPLAAMTEFEVEGHITAGHYDRFLDRLLRPLMARRRYLMHRLNKEFDMDKVFSETVHKTASSLVDLVEKTTEDLENHSPLASIDDKQLHEVKFNLEALAAILEAEIERRGQGTQDTAVSS